MKLINKLKSLFRGKLNPPDYIKVASIKHFENEWGHPWWHIAAKRATRRDKWRKKYLTASYEKSLLEDKVKSLEAELEERNSRAKDLEECLDWVRASLDVYLRSAPKVSKFETEMASPKAEIAKYKRVGDTKISLSHMTLKIAEFARIGRFEVITECVKTDPCNLNSSEADGMKVTLSFKWKGWRPGDAIAWAYNTLSVLYPDLPWEVSNDDPR